MTTTDTTLRALVERMRATVQTSPSGYYAIGYEEASRYWADELTTLLAEAEPPAPPAEAITRAKLDKDDPEYWRGYASSAHDTSMQLLDDYTAAITRAKLELLDEVEREFWGDDMRFERRVLDKIRRRLLIQLAP